MPAATLTREELNRATLARQMLLAREKTTALAAVERLAGLQAQLARPPFIGLWSRVAGFQAEDLRRLVRERKAVRGTLLRGTLHLVSAKDYLVMRPLLQPMLSRAMAGVFRERVKGLDIDAVVETARGCLEAEPQTFEGLRGRLLQAYPKLDERAMGYAVRTHLPLVQVPEEHAWGYPSAAAFAVAESFLRKRLAQGGDLAPLVQRYLAAFGPASPRDAAAWSGLEELAAAFEPLRPKLRVFRDERGRELFDLPKAPRPPARTPAPVRFLPDYDNLLLAHADRARVIADEHRRRVATANLRILPTFLVDGFVAGTWKVERSRAAAVLVLEPFQAVSRPARAALLEEGERLVRFVESDARTVEVRFAG
jgi:hypothetical protein